jgi:hypothetical protein
VIDKPTDPSESLSIAIDKLTDPSESLSIVIGGPNDAGCALWGVGLCDHPSGS